MWADFFVETGNKKILTVLNNNNNYYYLSFIAQIEIEQFHLQTKSSKIFRQAMVWLRNVILGEIIGNRTIEDHKTLSHFS